MRIANDVIGEWKSQILFTLYQLGIFDVLEKGPRSGSEIALALKIPEDPLRRFLNAVVAAVYMLKAGDQYSNVPATQAR